jgi:hypothetical protein
MTLLIVIVTLLNLLIVIVTLLNLLIVIVTLLNLTVIKILRHVSLQRNLENQKHPQKEHKI